MDKSAHNKAWSYAALVTAIVCIAWSAIFVRWTSIPGPASAFYRCLIPAIVLLPTWFLPGRRAKLRLRSYAIIAIGGFFFALDLAFYNTSILQTSATNSTLLGNNTPIIVGLLTWLLFRRRPAFSFWVGLALAVAGSAVIMGADWAKHTKFGLGDAMALAAAACFAVYLIATEEIRSHTTTLEFLRLAILGGYLALTFALGHLPATVTSVSLLSQGPLTAVLAALLLGEPLTGYQIAGGALVLLGVGLANHLGRPESEVNAAFGETADMGGVESNAGDDVTAYASKKLL